MTMPIERMKKLGDESPGPKLQVKKPTIPSSQPKEHEKLGRVLKPHHPPPSEKEKRPTFQLPSRNKGRGRSKSSR